MHNRIANIIYNLTGGRLSYSTYTLEGCEDAYRDQLNIDVERATKELEKENEMLKSENFTFEELLVKLQKMPYPPFLARLKASSIELNWNLNDSTHCLILWEIV